MKAIKEPNDVTTGVGGRHTPAVHAPHLARPDEIL